MQTQNCLIIAGEKSGEEHALSFFPELKRLCPDCDFWGVGGDELSREGLELIYHLKDFSSWGISEVITKIPFYFNALKKIENLALERKTKVAILIDFQTFNMKLARKLHKRGIKVLYYVAPQAWAWKSWRAKALSQCVHTLFSILPFEKEWFQTRGVTSVLGVDHPLWHRYKKDLEGENFIKNFPLRDPFKILLLPGSRFFEVNFLLPEFIKAISLLKEKYAIEVSLVRSPNLSLELFSPYEKDISHFYSNEDLAVALMNADFAISASGTVTLACALFEVPTVVCYKTSLLNQMIFRTFINYDGHISLANIIGERKVFPELLQEKATALNIKNELEFWMSSKEEYLKTKEGLRKMKDLVQGELKDPASYMANVIKEAR